MNETALRTPIEDVRSRVEQLDWNELGSRLDQVGHAITPAVFSRAECRQLAELVDEGRFRSTVEMARHRFGEGRYRYFDPPLPETITALRTAFYPHLATVANRWSELLGGDRPSFPLRHDELLSHCRTAGQNRPTPLILRHHEGDWNAVHQDLYGEVYFPFQVLIVLSQHEEDYEGGEFVLLEQRRRAQSRAHVLTPPQGACIIFPTAERPNKAPTATTAAECTTASPRSLAESERRSGSSSTTPDDLTIRHSATSHRHDDHDR